MTIYVICRNCRQSLMAKWVTERIRLTDPSAEIVRLEITPHDCEVASK